MKLLLSGLLVMMSTVTLSQYADSSATRLAMDYQKKSRKQNTAGWILLAGGAVLTTIGLIVGATDAVGDLIEGDTKGSSGGPILMFTGLVSMAGSIPLFIAAGKNRRKATATLPWQYAFVCEMAFSFRTSDNSYPVFFKSIIFSDMKKAVIFFAGIIVSTSCFCQLSKPAGQETSNNKIRFGIKAGVAIANSKIEYNNSTLPGNSKPKTKLGAMAGVFARIDLNSKTCFQPELLMVGKGMKENDQYYSYKANRTYLELPLNLLYKPQASKGSFFIGGGPAPAYYIGENVFYSGYNAIKKFDVGINILTGYELPVGFSINLNYTYGLLNISQNKTDVPVTKNRCFGLSVGYIF